MAKRACKTCRRVVEKDKCPVCGGDTTTNFQGTIVIFDVNSDIAKKLNITAPGRYAVKV